MRSIEQLTTEILSLPSVSRAFLAEKLVESLEFDTDSTLQATWVTEAKRRRDEVCNGTVTPISGEETFAQVRQLLLSQIETLETEELQQLQKSIQSKLAQHQTAPQAGFPQALLASGLTQQIKYPTSPQSIERRLVEIQGKPLSETILEERR
ncbi:addiction module protein [Altericista sp. CCNU0014]|uniref:addiction module protein n=1 Tax=Altericista sp. CCNU0014 TaxID=3082949 RepID=UPI00384B61FD